MILRAAFALFLFTTPVRHLPAQAAAATPAKPMMGSRVIDAAELTAKPTSVGLRRDVFDNPTPTLANAECHISTLNPGLMAHAPHRHPEEEVVFVREGTLEVTVNGQTKRVGPGSVLYFASNDLHGMRNVGAGPATYCVFRFATAATPAAPAAK